MKTIYKISYIAVIALATLSYSKVQAQEYKTNESVTDQLKNGTVPGLKYTSITKQPVQVGKTEKPKQYMKGNFKEVLFQNYNRNSKSVSVPANGLNKSAKSIAGSTKLASDSEVHKSDDKAKKVEAPKLPPMQGEESKKE